MNNSDKWPRIPYQITTEPRFLFIITPPYSGSTALAKVLNTSPRSMILNDNAEGQWLIPGMCEQDRWEPDKKIDWDSVKSVWLSQFQKISGQDETLQVIIEKSPPNLVRVKQIHDQFKKASSIAFNRDPYANCVSIFYRNYSPQDLIKTERLRVLGQLAEQWLFRSKEIKKAAESFAIPYFNYETFCAQPEHCVNIVRQVCPELTGVNVKASFTVKDYKEQGLVNNNKRQMQWLDRKDMDIISTVLERDVELLEYFAYKLL